jgi:protein gp37
MGASTKIEWCTSTWNPVRGCSRITPGCGGPNHQGGCYAEKIAARFSAPGQPFHGYAERTPHGGRWTGKLALIEDQLDLPLRWKKPRRIFVNSMSDLFHEALSDDDIGRVFNVMAMCPQHIFQVLTKRADRMQSLMTGPKRHDIWSPKFWHRSMPANIWLGVSVEDQERADERIPHLLATPAAVRFLSCEPLLGPLDLGGYIGPNVVGKNDALRGVDWVICGGESGPGARPCQLYAMVSIVDQCKAANVPVFVKQLGRDPRTPFVFSVKDAKGGDINEFPLRLQVRQFPGGDMPITKLEEVHESRLTWPENKPRAAHRGKSPFRSEIAKAEQEVRWEMPRWGVRDGDYIVSRNRTRAFAGDPGVALWWLDRKKQLKVVACDKYDTIAANLHAIYLTLDAMRALDRWGAYTIEQASEGAKVAMLPPPPSHEARHWTKIFQMAAYDTLAPLDRLAIAERRYRQEMANAGADEKAMVRFNLAIEAARKELKGNG